jgi:hypothetical protein
MVLRWFRSLHGSTKGTKKLISLACLNYFYAILDHFLNSIGIQKLDRAFSPQALSNVAFLSHRVCQSRVEVQA